MSIRLHIATPDELRDALPQSGIFEMYDCQLAIEAPGMAMEEDIEKMIAIVKSTINVTSAHVSYVVDNEDFGVTISEVPLQVAEGRIK